MYMLYVNTFYFICQNNIFVHYLLHFCNFMNCYFIINLCLIVSGFELYLAMTVEMFKSVSKMFRN